MTTIFRLHWRAFIQPKTPLIRQATLAECGLASLAMIANHWGWQIDLGTLRALAPPSMKGARLKTILSLASQHGLDGRVVRVSQPADLARLRLPAMIHLDEDHFVVLVETLRRGVIVHDPSIGRTTISWVELSKRSKGIVAEFSPGGAFVARDERRRLSLSSIWSHLSGVAPTITQIFLLSVLLQVTAAVAPLYVQLSVDEAVTRLDTDLLNVLFAGFAGLAVINGTAFFLRRIITLRVDESLSLGLMGNLFRHMLKLPSGFFQQRPG